MLQIEHYLTPNDQRNPFLDWLSQLSDRKAQVALIRRVAKLENGHFGDHKFCRGGVWELRIHLGPGYRIYYARCGAQVVLLLCGGHKGSQNQDIDRAVRYWNDWLQREDL